jgi:hypothetical protein
MKHTQRVLGLQHDSNINKSNILFHLRGKRIIRSGTFGESQGKKSTSSVMAAETASNSGCMVDATHTNDIIKWWCDQNMIGIHGK